ncbi:MAG TPA: hypothetical protein VII02_01755 [Gemmatimonadaceae bacterium]
MARARKAAGACLLAFLSGIGSGCYMNVPVATTPVAGNTLVLDLNDNGRVALGPRIGAAASTVEGVLESRTDTSYELSVTAVSYMNGQTNRWTNEPLSVLNSFVSQTQQRKFSRSRTALAAGLAVGGVLAFALTRSLLGSGSPGTTPGGDGGGTGQ